MVTSMQPLPTGKRPPRVLAIASSGGHWVELRRLRAAWDGCIVTYATTNDALANDLDHDPPGPDGSAPRLVTMVNVNRWSRKTDLIRLVFQLALLLVRSRPDVIVSTGSLPGYVAFRLGRLTGARLVWIESIANIEELSMSGRLAAPHSNLYLTQWPEQAETPEAFGLKGVRPVYAGKVL